MLVISNHSPNYSLNCIPHSPITIANNNDDDNNNNNNFNVNDLCRYVVLPLQHNCKDD